MAILATGLLALSVVAVANATSATAITLSTTQNLSTKPPSQRKVFHLRIPK